MHEMLTYSDELLWATTWIRLREWFIYYSDIFDKFQIHSEYTKKENVFYLTVQIWEVK